MIREPIPTQNFIKAAMDTKIRREANANLLAAAKALTRIHAAYSGPEIDDLRSAIARVEAVR